MIRKIAAIFYLFGFLGCLVYGALDDYSYTRDGRLQINPGEIRIDGHKLATTTEVFIVSNQMVQRDGELQTNINTASNVLNNYIGQVQTNLNNSSNDLRNSIGRVQTNFNNGSNDLRNGIGYAQTNWADKRAVRDLDMGGYSITNISPTSIKFSDGTEISSAIISNLMAATNTVQNISNTVTILSNQVTSISNSVQEIIVSTNSLNTSVMELQGATNTINASLALTATNIIYRDWSTNWIYFEPTNRSFFACITNGGSGGGGIDENANFTMADGTTGSLYSAHVRHKLYMTNSESAGALEEVQPMLDAASDGKTYGRKDGAWVEAGTAAQGTYPVFQLDVGMIEGRWNEFEIKGSTDNFAHVVYYFQSWTNYTASTTDTNAYLYFTDDCATDVRKWKKATNGWALAEQLDDPLSVVQSVVFMPSHNCSNLWSDWMQATNTKLIWSWVRANAISYETNAVNEGQRWNPIRPQSWDVERTEP